MRSRLIVIILSLLSTAIFAQEDATIILKQADKFIGRNIDGNTFNFLSGNVILEHDSITFYCDSAEIDRASNNFNAFGNIYAIMSDSVELYGDRLKYFGNTKVAHVYDNVKLIDNKATLYTEYLVYHRLEKRGVYNRKGRIVDGENELNSLIGEYYSDKNEYFFTVNVELTTPDYVVNTDTLRYNTETEIAYFNGYSTLKGEDDFMFAFKGWTDTQKNLTSLKKHATVQHKKQIIYGDSVYYDKEIEYGYASKNAVLMDTEKEMVIEGQIVEYIKQKGYAYATDSAFAVLIDQKDSLFLHSDTLKLLLDSTDISDKLLAFNKVKFFREDLQGACDSLIYDFKDSVISMYISPILWSNKNQLTSDSIKIYMTNQKMDSMVMHNSAFIVSIDSTDTYNQIKGRDVIAYFRDNEMYKIKVNGNSETVYYMRDDISKELIGINKAASSNMIIFIEKREIVDITYISNPKATLYPEFEITQEERLLRGFKWLHHLRPRSKLDIFKQN